MNADYKYSILCVLLTHFLFGFPYDHSRLYIDNSMYKYKYKYFYFQLRSPFGQNN